MSLLIKFILFAFCFAIFTCQSVELALTTKQKFKLKADHYKPQVSSDRAVLLLHQCNFNRTMYDNIGQELSLRGIHALSFDFRWMGESIDEKTDIRVLAKLPPEQRKNPWAKVMEHWPEDVQLAYDFLRKKVGNDGLIGVVGASCGGRQAKVLAEKNSVSAFSFFSSAVVSSSNEEDVASYKSQLAKKPTLFISAEQDSTFAGTQKGFELNENLNTKFLAYKGEEHGYPLLEQDNNLAKTIALWFDRNLTSTNN